MKRAYPLVVLVLFVHCGLGCGTRSPGPDAPAGTPQASAEHAERGEAPAQRPTPREAAVPGMDGLLGVYLAEADRLASDDFKVERAGVLAKAVGEITADPAPAWLAPLREALDSYASAPSIDEARRHFGTASGLLIGYVENHGTELELHQFHCPMAPAGIEGSWLQAGDTARNPWYGARMLNCGVRRW